MKPPNHSFGGCMQRYKSIINSIHDCGGHFQEKRRKGLKFRSVSGGIISFTEKIAGIKRALRN